jgi:hypothetical protein
LSKTVYQYGIKAISGTLDGLVHMPCQSGFGSYTREWVMPTLTADNHLKGAVCQNLASVWHNCAAAYITDIKTYTQRYFQEHLSPLDWDPCWAPFGMFLKMMYGWQASDPEHVDLSTVTVGDIISLDADVKTIARAVTAEFLPFISVSDDLTHPIQV